MWFLYDPTFPLLVIAIIIGLIAQQRVASTFAKYSKIPSARGFTAAKVARLILDQNGLSDISIQGVRGSLTDHYDPKKRVIRLSEPVYSSTSLAALGVAAHEVGHAIQHAQGYQPMKIRQALYPMAAIGSQMLAPAVIGGILLGLKPLVYIGIFLYFFAVIFTVVTLPVEFDASRRSLKTLEESGYLIGQEIEGAKKVLKAAAMTYVAAVVVSVIQLIRLLMIARDSRD